MNKTTISLCFLLLLSAGCVTNPPMTGLEQQAFQRREFDAKKEIAFASLVSVLQDYGYIIESADLTTGLITGGSPTKNVVFFGSHMSNTRVSAFVEAFGDTRSAIRMNFVEVKESSSGYGMKAKKDTPVLDAAIYDEIFEKISEAIFIRQNI